MDAIFPYLARAKPADLAGPAHSDLISPVLKYTRIAGEQKQQHQHRIGWQDPARQGSARRQQQQQQQQQPEAAADPKVPVEEESHWLQTGHVVTPEADQHADAEGHLDIYI
jgi:hypothetical protein